MSSTRCPASHALAAAVAAAASSARTRGCRAPWTEAARVAYC
ncbi:hypothetical protein [Streptomyces sp. URMC 125]